jgi:hypothetical protein
LTAAKYRQLYLRSAPKARVILREGSKEIRLIYIEAADMVRNTIEVAEKAGVAELTSESWASIEAQLLRGSEIIRQKLPPIVEESVINVSKIPSSIDEEYLIDILEDLNISTIGIRNLFVGIDEKLIASLYSRINEAGYSFSEAVWDASTDYNDKIKRVVELGLSQGRDMMDIARDIDVYVRKDRRTLLRRIGKLERGTKSFARRIGKSVDYNSIRILRSELYASLQEASKIAGELNPGATGMYDWVRTFAEDFNCACPEYEADSPYELNDLPSYPHPNCSCLVRPILRDREEFVNDLKRWSEGEPVDYLDEWDKSHTERLIA